MDVYLIKQMLSSQMLYQSEERQKIVMSSVLKSYALMGLSRSVSQEAMREEALVITAELVKDIDREKRFQSLRVQEVDYAVCSGIKGDFTVQTFSLSYQTIYKWLRAYVESPERKQAMESLLQDRRSKQLAARNIPSKKEQEQIIIDGINESYQTFLEVNGQTINAFPLVIDLGGVKNKYLTQKGLKPASMPLESYYKKCAKQKKVKIL